MLEKNYFNRRELLKATSYGFLAALVQGILPTETLAELVNIEPIIITKIEIVKLKNFYCTWLILHTNIGIKGFGETYYLDDSQIGAIRDLSNLVIGKDARNIERIWRDLYFRAAFTVTGGAEMRMISAINIALLDILGKYLGIPVYNLIGGKARDKIKVYNSTFGITRPTPEIEWTNEKDIEKIAKFLLDQGVTAIKLWPFDSTAVKNTGSYISPTEIEESLSWIKRIRKAVGDDLEIAVEFHGYWNLTCALRIAEALKPYNIMWIEDIMLPDNMQSYSVLAKETKIPICISERLATRYQYREMLEAKACDIVMYDVTWCGGISEAKKISDFADTYYIPSAPHTCGGPILWYASIHVATALTNMFIMESTHTYHTYDFTRYIADYPIPVDGYVSPPEEPGLGLHILPEIFENGEATVVPIAEK